MHTDKPFFMRVPWIFDPKAENNKREDARLGFETRALPAGFHPMQKLDEFRSFVPPITQSMTFP